MPPKQKMTVMEYQHPIWRNILHPIESLKSYSKTGKSLGKQLSDLKKEIAKIEEEVNTAKTKLRGRRNAVTMKELNKIKKSVRTLKLLELGLTKSYIRQEGLDKSEPRPRSTTTSIRYGFQWNAPAPQRR